VEEEMMFAPPGCEGTSCLCTLA